MYKKTVSYIDFFGEERTEDFYFHYSQAELSKMELSTTGGITRFVDKIIQTKDNPKLVDLFETFILDAYGEKSEDGRRFIKSEELSTAFSQTPAYSQIFIELLTDDEELARFIKEVVPKDISEKMTEVSVKDNLSLTDTNINNTEEIVSE